MEDYNIKMSVFPKLIYRFNKIPIKKTRAGLCENWQPDSEPYIKIQRDENS